MPEVELRTHTDADPAPEEAIRLVASERSRQSGRAGHVRALRVLGEKVIRLGWAARFFAFPSVHVLSRDLGEP